MSSYKLTYFNIMGLGEAVRFMLSYLGKDFEDKRIEDFSLWLSEYKPRLFLRKNRHYLGKDFEDKRIEDFSLWLSEYKPKMPYGKLPLLEIDEKKAHQTLAICRYLGREGKIAGETPWESFEIDMIMDTFSDFRVAIWAYFYCRDEEYRGKIKTQLFNVTVPFYLGKFDNIIKENGYLANGKLSWGDIYFVAILGYLSFMIEEDICEKYENIRSLRDRIHEIPNIQKWLKKRPETSCNGDRNLTTLVQRVDVTVGKTGYDHMKKVKTPSFYVGKTVFE